MLRALAWLLWGSFVAVVLVALVAGVYMASGRSPTHAALFIGLFALACGAAWGRTYLDTH